MHYFGEGFERWNSEAKKEAPKAKASKNKIDYSKFDKLELSSDEEEEKPRV